MMNIFKTPSPDMSMQPEMARSQRSDMMGTVSPTWPPPAPTGPVKVAQSYDEGQKLLQCGSCGDYGARSVKHAERPRYGHKV